MNDRSIPASYFDALYAADPDPWRFASSSYERDKYATTLGCLPRARYASVLEVGCSIGVLTYDLAGRCEQLLAIDAAAAPLEQARRRCAGQPKVRFARMAVPEQWPPGPFDLILLSEVVYYLSVADVKCLARRVENSLATGGDVVLVHWTGETNYPLSGDEASDLFLREAGGFIHLVDQRRTDSFRLDVASRC